MKIEDTCSVCNTKELRFKGIIFWKPPGKNIVCADCTILLIEWASKNRIYWVLDKKTLRNMIKSHHPDTGGDGDVLAIEQIKKSMNKL